jgi:hypothetical protein
VVSLDCTTITLIFPWSCHVVGNLPSLVVLGRTILIIQIL